VLVPEKSVTPLDPTTPATPGLRCFSTTDSPGERLRSMARDHRIIHAAGLYRESIASGGSPLLTQDLREAMTLETARI
jgi:hypothetical protein